MQSNIIDNRKAPIKIKNYIGTINENSKWIMSTYYLINQNGILSFDICC